MPQDIVVISAIVIVAMGFTTSFLQGKRVNRKTRRERNAKYPFKLFQLAHGIPNLKKYLPELANECALVLFPGKMQTPVNPYNIPLEDIEKICVEHSKKIVPQLELLTKKKIPYKSFPQQRPQVFLYLVRQHIAGLTGRLGDEFMREVLSKHHNVAHQILIGESDKSEKSLKNIYTDVFYSKIASLALLNKYPLALEHLVNTYLKSEAGVEGKRLLAKLLKQNNVKIYEMIIDKLPSKNSLSVIYTDNFFQRINTLEEIQKYPEAFPFLLRSFLKNQAGINATAVVEKALSKHGKTIYRNLFEMIYKSDNKEFALQMIQNYSHLSNKVKLGILRQKQGDRYVDASIKKISEGKNDSFENSEEEEWGALFETISEMIGTKVKVPDDLAGARKIKKLLEFHRDNATSSGNMLKVLDIEKLLENMDNYYQWLQTQK